MGVFVLASTADIAAPDVLDAYYARQRIEQVFDVGKNYASLLPLRVHSEEAPGGHLPPAFCAAAPSCRPGPGIPVIMSHKLDALSRNSSNTSLSSGLSWVILLGLTIVSSFQSFLGRTDILG